MNITFLIGNGFDLRVGMKTRFVDMYEAYIAQPSASNAIKKFKEMLQADAPGYVTWGDFEMAMAEKAKEFDDETSFIECLRDFKLHMASHLEREQNAFKKRMSITENAKRNCIRELYNSIVSFYKGFTPNVINEFINLGIEEKTQYYFVSFNYTDVFDNLLRPNIDLVDGNDILHIHGSLEAEVVLGADNLGQVVNLPYITTRRFERAFIKPAFNNNYDRVRLSNAESFIDKSNIICIYGMSLGKSDLSWIERLKNWLLSDKNNHLVYFTHDHTTFNKLNWDALIDEEEDRITTLLGRIFDSSDEMNIVFNQVHIPVGFDIFSIDEILKSEKIKADEEVRKREEILKLAQEQNKRNLAASR